jgi:hypothetical protein
MRELDPALDVRRDHRNGAPSTGLPADLPLLVESYADMLVEQAAVLMSLPGHLEVENRAEAAAYMTVVADLSRLLRGELSLANLTG